jgi:hypothetical protein
MSQTIAIVNSCLCHFKLLENHEFSKNKQSNFSQERLWKKHQKSRYFDLFISDELRINHSKGL